MTQTTNGPEFQPGLEAIEGRDVGDIPRPVNPLQAQTQFERRASREDWFAHGIAVLVVLGFFGVTFALLLGFVDLKEPTIATLAGTSLGYAVGKIDPILSRYFHVRGLKLASTSTHRSNEGTNGRPD